MASPRLHRNDTMNAISGTTNNKVIIGIIVDIFDWCIDREKTGKSAQMLDTQILLMQKYEITMNSLYQSCLAHGAGPKIYPMSKLDVIRQWLLSAYSPWHKLSTHQGWVATASHPPWLVKRDLLVNLIRGI